MAASEGEDYYAKLGVSTIINAAGVYTILTAACMPPEVRAAVYKAALHPAQRTQVSGKQKKTLKMTARFSLVTA